MSLNQNFVMILRFWCGDLGPFGPFGPKDVALKSRNHQKDFKTTTWPGLRGPDMLFRGSWVILPGFRFCSGWDTSGGTRRIWSSLFFRFRKKSPWTFQKLCGGCWGKIPKLIGVCRGVVFAPNFLKADVEGPWKDQQTIASRCMMFPLPLVTKKSVRFRWKYTLEGDFFRVTLYKIELQWPGTTEKRSDCLVRLTVLKKKELCGLAFQRISCFQGRFFCSFCYRWKNSVAT